MARTHNHACHSERSEESQSLLPRLLADIRPTDSRILRLTLVLAGAFVLLVSLNPGLYADITDEPTARKLFLEVERIARLPSEEQSNEVAHVYTDLFPVIRRRLYANLVLPTPITDYRTLSLSEAANKVASHGGWPALQEAAMKNCQELLIRHKAELVPLIREDLASADNAKVSRALAAVGDFRLGEFFEDVLAVFRKNTRLSQRAAYTLRDLGDSRAIQPLVESDSKQLVEYFELLRSLSRSRPADPALVRLLDSDDPQARWHAAYALAESGDDSLLPHVARLIRDENPLVRRSAANIAFSLSKEAFAKLRPSLIALLNDRDAMVRFDVGIYFASRDDDVSASSLVKLMRDGVLEGGYNSTVVQSLRTLTGSYFGYDLSLPPNATTNQAALDNFEKWIKEHVHEELKR
jgi:HEAT repeat protein